VRLWVQSLVLSKKIFTTNDWIKKMWYIYTREYHLAIKENEIMSLAGK
jgi:hypothetical protein